MMHSRATALMVRTERSNHMLVTQQRVRRSGGDTMIGVEVLMPDGKEIAFIKFYDEARKLLELAEFEVGDGIVELPGNVVELIDD